MTPAGTSDLLARFLGDNVASGDLIGWAVQALVDGYDTPALRDLAGLDVELGSRYVRWLEAADLFRRSLAELEIPIPDRETALRDHLRVLAAKIVAGEIPPDEGLGRIWHEVQKPLHYPSDLIGFDFLHGGIHPSDFYHRDVVGEERDQLIVEEARKLLDPQRDEPHDHLRRGPIARFRSMLCSRWSRE